jgi:hypothetical protein
MIINVPQPNCTLFDSICGIMFSPPLVDLDGCFLFPI